MRRHLVFLTATAVLASGPVIGQSARIVGKEFSTGARATVSGMPDVAIDDVSFDGLSGKRAAEILRRVQDDVPLATRGPREVQLFRNAARSVVLVVTDDGIGSGAVLDQATVLTNWHVVGANREVGLVFKPEQEGRKIGKADVFVARVVRIDQVADLALLRIASAPAHAKALQLGESDDIQIGADVHAIGHPTGEAWTYTKGIISQVRQAYEWSGEGSHIVHKADVIQTQTPINPGNSGGPLLSDGGKLIGVNSFKAEGEGLNFAVSLSEVRRFLAATSSRVITPPKFRQRKAGCEVRVVFEGRSKKGDAFVRTFDTDCDGRTDIAVEKPDDSKEPYLLLVDTNDDGKPDIYVLDQDRDGRWDVSYLDTNFDGKPDLVGYHPDGKAKPTRYAQYEE
jgi:S1-C subfamily serine protease